jgi:hypothetical protein
MPTPRAGGQQAGGDQRGGQRGGANRGGRGGPGGFDLNELLGFGGGGPEVGGGGPLTTDAFAEWSDRLREVEQLIDLPELQADVARARERARLERSEARRALKKPDWAVVELEILGPLVEVRRELDAELARRTAEDPLLPVDRDPVPTRFTELVRRYYEALGSGAPRPAGE